MNWSQKFVPFICTLALGGLAAFSASSARADISVRFIEGAPKDRFEITNRAKCAVVSTELVIDLGASAGGLIFDVTGTGAGVEVFQPFEVVTGADALASRPKVADGDKLLQLSIRRLAPGKRIAFTIDVDDTVGPRGITVSGSEIAGAVVRLTANGTANGVTASASFSRQAEVVVPTPPCS